MANRYGHYVDVEPYREALLAIFEDEPERRVELAKIIFGHLLGPSPRKRMTNLLRNQSSITRATAERIAMALDRRDLMPVTEPHVSDTITRVGVDPCPNSGTSAHVLLARARDAIDLLKHDNTISPERALEMVVWPPSAEQRHRAGYRPA